MSNNDLSTITGNWEMAKPTGDTRELHIEDNAPPIVTMDGISCLNVRVEDNKLKFLYDNANYYIDIVAAKPDILYVWREDPRTRWDFEPK